MGSEGNVGTEDVNRDRTTSVFSNGTLDGDVDADDRRFSLGEQINQILREELGSANITSTSKKAAWPIYTKRRGGVLSERDEPPCKAVMFDVARGRGTVGSGELSRENATNTREGVPENYVTSSGFFTLVSRRIVC